MRSFIASLLLTLFAHEVHAQSDMADFKRVLYRFLVEQRVFLNCSALDPAQHGLVVGQFEDMTNATIDLLRTYGTSADVEEFQDATTGLGVAQAPVALNLWSIVECRLNRSTQHRR